MGKGQVLVRVKQELQTELCLGTVSHISFRKPCGIRAARKLRVVRRNERWADKVSYPLDAFILQTYKKGHNISSIKANVLGGATMAKGIVLEKV